MKYATLGNSGLSVSRVCLGSMTWGGQNTQADADAQLEYALAQGINFIDTAEMYAIPVVPENAGKTEKIIGNWLARNTAKRGDIVLASKIAHGLPWIRDGRPLDGESVKLAVDTSLQRLQTDYIDLYQLHWPLRNTPHFGKHWPNAVRFTEADPATQEANMLEVLQALGDCVDAGKIRHCGLSDDTTWGIATYLKLADKHNLPRMVSIQNEFNLLHTKDWPYLIEHCQKENVAYLPWSPLAGGALSGKYLGGARPAGSRWSFAQRNGLFRDTPEADAAVAAFKAVAEKHGLSATQLALKWCDQIDGVTSSIIGATTIEQLKEDIAAYDLDYTEALGADVLTTLKQHPVAF